MKELVPLEKMYSAAQLAEQFSMSPKAVYRLAKSGSFPRPIRIGGRMLRWRHSEIQKYQQESMG